MYSLPEANTPLELAMTVRILLAAALGTLIGVERSLAGKHAGMRTYALVSMGSALFVSVGLIYQLFYPSPGVDISRVEAAVIMGIGFIGSGLAFLHAIDTESNMRSSELTTAAGIWVAAGVGAACGFGLFVLPIAATLLTLFIFNPLMLLERAAQKRFREKGAQNLE